MGLFLNIGKHWDKVLLIAMIEDYISKKLSINKGVITFIQNRN